jgi:exportin-T
MSHEEKKSLNYAAFPLTHLGEMMMTLVQSGVSAYPHSFVVMQYFETVTRYSDFFKVRKDCIMPVLQAMIDTR